MPGKGQGFTVLVADDEPEVVSLVQIVLESEGYKVQVAINGRDAVEKIESTRPDLILLDVRMPEMTGLTVLDHLRNDPVSSSTPVIMLSVVVTDPEIRTALERGAIAYLSKPFELRELVWLIERILAMDSAQRDDFRQQSINNIGRRN
jgi:CheY-like chemotaxis protein